VHSETYREDESRSREGSNGSSVEDSRTVGVGQIEGGTAVGEGVVEVEEESESRVLLQKRESRTSLVKLQLQSKAWKDCLDVPLALHHRRR
jgi:hypothetical protein